MELEIQPLEYISFGRQTVPSAELASEIKKYMKSKGFEPISIAEIEKEFGRYATEPFLRSNGFVFNGIGYVSVHGWFDRIPAFWGRCVDYFSSRYLIIKNKLSHSALKDLEYPVLFKYYDDDKTKSGFGFIAPEHKRSFLCKKYDQQRDNVFQ